MTESTNPRLRMLDAAIEVLLADPSTVIGSIGFEETAAKVGVSRSSAYRAFDTEGATPSQAFRDAIAARVIERTRLGEVPEELSAISQLVDALADAVAIQPAEVSASMLRNFVRTFGNAIFDSYASDQFAPVILTVQLGSSGSEPLEAAIDRSIEASRAAFTDLFTSLAAIFDAELQPGWTWEGFSAAAGNPLAGHMINRFASGNTQDLELPTGPDGRLQRWTTFAVGMWGLLTVAWLFPPSLSGALTALTGQGGGPSVASPKGE